MDRPPSRSERLLRSTLERNPPQAAYASPPRAHRRRHSHVPAHSTETNDNDDDEHVFRGAFLYRTAATASSPVRPQYHSPRHGQRTSNSPSPTRDYYSHDSRSRSRAASPSSSSQYHRAASPSPRRQSLQRSPASVDGAYYGMSLHRHNSTPARRRQSNANPAPVDALPLTPHEQVLRARLERVLISGRVVDERERSREHASASRRSRDDSVSPGWPWSDQSLLASTPPKSSSSSDYLPNSPPTKTHHRSRSKTDPLTPPPHHPPTPRRNTTTMPSSPTTKHHFHAAQRNNSGNSSTWTPPLTADTSPVLSDPEAQSLNELGADDALILTPPPTPPLYSTNTNTTVTPALTAVGGTRRPSGVGMFRTRTRESASSEYYASNASSPYLYRREVSDNGSVEQLDLSLAAHHQHGASFNARKASESCRKMDGYVSFAQVEGLGMPPDGVDDDDANDLAGEGKHGVAEGKRGRVLNIGTWAKKLFVGVAAAQS